MKFKYKLISFGIIVGVLTLFSCKKYINEGPINAPYEGNFWDSQKSAQNALAGAYGLLKNALTDKAAYFITGDATANEYSVYGTGFGGLDALLPDNHFNFHYVPYYEPILWNWSKFYKVISQCNLILEAVPKMDASFFAEHPDARNKIIGQAYFLRAFTYYYITKVWGEPVIVTKNYPNPLEAPALPRSTDQKGFEQVIADLTESIKMLSYGYDNSTNVAVTADKGAAFSILAKVYMSQHKYQEAASATDSVLTFGGYQLENGDNFNKIFLGRNPESIFELNMLYTSTQNESLSGYDHWFGEFLADPFIKGKEDHWHVNTDLVGNLFDTTAATQDKRVNFTFYGLHNSDREMMVKYSNVIYNNAQLQTDPFVSNNLVIIRLADIILLRAEALTKLHQPDEAVMLLNEIRGRAGLDDYTYTNETELHYNIMDERGRELFGEGQWYFDLVRSGLLTDPGYQFHIDEYTEARVQGRGFLWPLDLQKLLAQDPLLTQNSWWSSH